MAAEQAPTAAEVHGLLRGLSRRTAYLLVSASDAITEPDIRIEGHASAEKPARIGPSTFQLAAACAWIAEEDGGWRLTPAGADALRRMASGSTPLSPALAPTVNEAESPLGWLRRRAGRDGKPFLEDPEFDAGERLRADFTFAQLTPRVTSSWSELGTRPSGGRAPHSRDMTDNVVAARTRVDRAMTAVGPELSGLLLDVCCHLKRLEVVEVERNWPKRSAKVMLKCGLQILARHYGIAPKQSARASNGPARVLSWSDRSNGSGVAEMD